MQEVRSWYHHRNNLMHGGLCASTAALSVLQVPSMHPSRLSSRLSNKVSEAIRDGAEGFFKTQYGTISKMSFLLSVIIYLIYIFRPPTPEQEAAGITQ
eukprot:4450235-Pyramimonas_sp.AAC.2